MATTHPREIVSPEAYPPEILTKLEKGRNYWISLANRWMLGWPERVKTLLSQGAYWEALVQQTERELDALSESTPYQESNFSQWEIVQQAGLDLAPPVPS
ncbi:MAG: hypothetical protein LBU76_06040 [Azoarcus sp.]|jgi:hypothetical protein|nr:hypothetical protein [Azoarcus sp.]